MSRNINLNDEDFVQFIPGQGSPTLTKPEGQAIQVQTKGCGQMVAFDCEFAHKILITGLTVQTNNLQGQMFIESRNSSFASNFQPVFDEHPIDLQIISSSSSPTWIKFPFPLTSKAIRVRLPDPGRANLTFGVTGVKNHHRSNDISTKLISCKL